MPITRRKHTHSPEQPENNNHLGDPIEQPAESSEGLITEQTAPDAGDRENPITPTTAEIGSYQTIPAVANGERHDYPPPIEGGRRTARGELFRRPPQPPVGGGTPPTAPVVPVPLQTPSHEISLPLGNLLHLAYNPGYTSSAEARSILLQQLAKESKAGGRARCWSCGSLAVIYDRWNTSSKTFGEIGIASCEICGAWSVL